MQRNLWIIPIVLVVIGAVFVASRQKESNSPPLSVGSPSTAPSAANSSSRQPNSTAVNSNLAAQHPGLPSKAAWADGARLLDARDFKTLVANARNNPAGGSYALAAKALSTCAAIVGSDPKVKKEIEKAGNAPARMHARDVLMWSCEGLGDEQTMMRLRDELYGEGEKAGDALMGMAAEAKRLSDSKVNREQRQQRLAELLSLNDPQVLSAVRPALMAAGATFDGEPVPERDRAAYGFALQMASCSEYGACGGANSTMGHRDCALHGECDYVDVMGAAQRMMAPVIYERAGQYYLRVRDRLAQGNFTAFGLP